MTPLKIKPALHSLAQQCLASCPLPASSAPPVATPRRTPLSIPSHQKLVFPVPPGPCLAQPVCDLQQGLPLQEVLANPKLFFQSGVQETFHDLCPFSLCPVPGILPGLELSIIIPLWYHLSPLFVPGPDGSTFR